MQGGGRRHYQPGLLETAVGLLKNSGDFQGKKYSLFKRRFFKTLSWTLSGEGFYERK
jgi:hypothetical protein